MRAANIFDHLQVNFGSLKGTIEQLYDIIGESLLVEALLIATILLLLRTLLKSHRKDVSLEDAVARSLIPLILLGNIWMNYQGVTQFILPNYGNTMYQLAFSRFIMEHGERVPLALEYGGLSRNYYVPGFRVLIGVMGIVLSHDIVPTAQIFMVLFSLIFPLVFYSIGKRLTGRPAGGLAVALMFLTAPELQIYVVRPLPQMLGLFFIPLIVYAFTLSYSLMALFGFMVAMIHPQSMASVCFTLGMAALLYSVVIMRSILFLRRPVSGRELFMLIGIALLVGGPYLLWHRLQAGTFSLDVLAPARFKEFGKSLGISDYLRTGEFVFAFGIVGAYLLSLDTRYAHPRGRMLVLGWVLGTFLLTKNEVLGVGSHTERFLAFLQEALVVTSGLVAYYLWRLLDDDVGPVPTEKGFKAMGRPSF